MKNNENLNEDDKEVLPSAWLGVLGVATSVSADSALDDKTVARVKTSLMERVRNSNAKFAFSDHEVVLKDAQWQSATPRIHYKVLRNDGVTLSWLLKLLPGTTLPAHAHADCDEECLVMEGSLRLDGKLLNAGDYTVASKGTKHRDIYSELGCVAFLKSPSASEHGLAFMREA